MQDTGKKEQEGDPHDKQGELSDPSLFTGGKEVHSEYELPLEQQVHDKEAANADHERFGSLPPFAMTGNVVRTSRRQKEGGQPVQ